MSIAFSELAAMAASKAPEFGEAPRQACVEAARNRVRDLWEMNRQRHREGESGNNVVRLLTEAADEVVRGVAHFGLYQMRQPGDTLSRMAICALGGYGRRELNPYSDLDIGVLYEGRLNADIKNFNSYFMTFLWDMGFQAGYTFHNVLEAVQLCQRDPEVFTSYAQARLLLGSEDAFSRFRVQFDKLRKRDMEHVLQLIRQREQVFDMPADHQDLYAPEPDVKQNAGGLRDYHAALWLASLKHGTLEIDDLQRLELLTGDECLEVVEALDVLHRIRNELHFETGKCSDQLTFDLQRHAATVFGYGEGSQRDIDRFMQDYYTAAQRMRGFLQRVVHLCDSQMEMEFFEGPGPRRSKFTVYRGQLCSGTLDRNWFAESPVRLMQVILECARRRVPLSPTMRDWLAGNLHLVSYAFRSSEVVRRYFVAVCSRPLQAGLALRQAAQTGLLGTYIPEFEAIRGIVRYEDFHSYPVDEHTLRAIEALAEIPRMPGSVANVLQRNLEYLRQPHILVMAILLHDLGKAAGETHAQEGVRIARTVCARIGLPEEEAERIEFLVANHMAMAHIAFYRDTNDVDIVNEFAMTMKTDQRLRELLLLTYADLAAVGPNVWNEWKGALLLKLFLKAERILLGRSEVAEEEAYWTLPKASEVRRCAPAHLRPQVDSHLRGLGERYFIAFPPEEIAAHMECLEEARKNGLALRCITLDAARMSEVVVCTRDRAGLFAEIAGSFAAQLVDVQGAALFTGPDGWVVDCFTVRDARNARPLTTAQLEAFEKTLGAVLNERQDVQPLVDQSRKRLFALLRPRAPVRTRVAFDDHASASDTVVDIETGDRTGLLYDMARALTGLGIDIQSARIMTDARRVRDSFYVRKDNRKLEEDFQAAAHRELMEAIDSMLAAESKGGHV